VFFWKMAELKYFRFFIMWLVCGICRLKILDFIHSKGGTKVIQIAFYSNSVIPLNIVRSFL